MDTIKQILQPFKYAWDISFTKFWGYFQMLGASTLFAADRLNATIENPTFKSYLSQMDTPHWIIVTLAAFGLITWLAHGREND